MTTMGAGRSPRVLVPLPRAGRDALGRLVARLAQDIAGALERSGAQVRCLPPDVPVDIATEALQRCAGLVLAGGGDVDPARYGGQADHPALSHVDLRRDEVESTLVRAAMRRDLPILGVCRGAQLLNVVLGGTLCAHLDNSEVVHHGSSEALFVRHDVVVRDGAAVAAAIGAGEQTVWSGHHQAIEVVAPGLEVVATAHDGVIEAVEHRERPIVGVQWHPEYAETHPPSVPDPLFGQLVERARRVRPMAPLPG